MAERGAGVIAIKEKDMKGKIDVGGLSTRVWKRRGNKTIYESHSGGVKWVIRRIINSLLFVTTFYW